MNITRDNYSLEYLNIKNKIQTCKFISFDEEMSGINSFDPLLKYRKDDTPEIRYNKMISIATKYNIIQFGLCLFHDTNDGTGNLIASPYNIYLFPDSGCDIVLSSSSIDFLRKNNMDFGLWISKGVTYVDSRGDEWLKKKYFITSQNDSENNNNNNNNTRKQIVLTKKSDLDFMESNFDKFKQFLNNDDADIFEFDDCNSYLRRYIYEHIETCYSNEVVLKKKENNRLYAYKVSKQSNEEFELEQKLQREKDYSTSIGFRQLYLDLIESKKPIVGHNNLFDLMFMFRWFDSALPPTFNEFRTNLHSKFPSIYDTKYIESYIQDIQPSTTGQQQQQDTYLEQCYNKYLQSNNSKITITIHSDCSSFDPTSPNYHNAGYDAYCTGYIFAHQMFHLQQLQNQNQDKDENQDENENEQSINQLSFNLNNTTENKLFLMFNIFHIDLNPNNQSISPRYYNSVLLRVTNFNKDITTETLLGVEFHNTTITYDLNLEIIWIDDNSLFILFPNSKEDDERVINYQKYAPSNWNFQTIDEYLFSLQNSKVKDNEDENEGDDEKSDGIIEEDSIHIKGTPTKRNEKKRNSFLGTAFNVLLSPFRWASSIDQNDDNNNGDNNDNNDDNDDDDSNNNGRMKRKREE